MLAIALGALSLGVLYYAVARHPAQVYFLSRWLPVQHAPSAVPGGMGTHLPTFVHVYAFILLTVAVTAPRPAQLIPICLAWLALDSLFEIAQLRSIGRWIADHSPAWFAGIPFLENTPDYFLSGTFDALDLLSIVVGTLAAYVTAYAAQGRLSHGKGS